MFTLPKWRVPGSKINIGVDTAPLNGNRTGIGNYVSNLLKAIIQLNCNVNLLAFSRYNWSEVRLSTLDNDNQNVFFQKSRKLEFLKKNQLILNAYRASRRFMYNAKQSKIDFFHAFVYRPPEFTGIPFLPVIYDLSHKRFPHFHPKERINWMNELDFYMHEVPMVHTISEFSKLEISTYYGINPKKISVIYPGLNPLFISSEIDQEKTRLFLDRYKIRPSGFVLSVATLEPRKNLRTLVEAYRIMPVSVRKRFPLIVVGDDGWGNPFENQILDQLKSEGSLRFIGYQSDLALKILYSNCKIFCYTSLYEGFGMPVAEALSMSACVIASDLQVFREISQTGITFVDPLDVQAWANKISEFLDGAHNGSNLDRYCVDKFSWNDSAKRTLQLYNVVQDNLNL